jgi:S1-C subfamily serine protease
MEIRNERGVVNTAVHERTPADLIELLPGMVITEVNHQPIQTVEDLRKAFDAQPANQTLLMRYDTSGSRFMAIRADF